MIPVGLFQLSIVYDSVVLTALSCYAFAVLQLAEELLSVIFKCILCYGLRTLHVWGFVWKLSAISAKRDTEIKVSLYVGFVFFPRIMNQSHVSLAVALSACYQENVLTVVLLIALGFRSFFLLCWGHHMWSDLCNLCKTWTNRLWKYFQTVHYLINIVNWHFMKWQ